MRSAPCHTPMTLSKIACDGNIIGILCIFEEYTVEGVVIRGEHGLSSSNLLMCWANCSSAMSRPSIYVLATVMGLSPPPCATN